MSAPRKRPAFVLLPRPVATHAALVVVSGLSVLYAAAALGVSTAALAAIYGLGVRTVRIGRTVLDLR